MVVNYSQNCNIAPHWLSIIFTSRLALPSTRFYSFHTFQEYRIPRFSKLLLLLLSLHAIRMSKTKVTVNNNGSLRIEGDFEIVDKLGNPQIVLVYNKDFLERCL